MGKYTVTNETVKVGVRYDTQKDTNSTVITSSKGVRMILPRYGNYFDITEGNKSISSIKDEEYKKGVKRLRESILREPDRYFKWLSETPNKGQHNEFDTTILYQYVADLTHMGAWDQEIDREDMAGEIGADLETEKGKRATEIMYTIYEDVIQVD